MEALQGLKIDNWYKALLVFSAAIFVACLAFNTEHEFRKAMLLGSMGGFFVGLGEWINHPLQERIGTGWGQLFKLSGHPRKAHFGGFLLDAVGVLLIARCIWLLW